MLSVISIHTPLAGSDFRSLPKKLTPENFNPHSPCGERPGSMMSPGFRSDFNPHSPCGERPTTIPSNTPSPTISIHTPLAGSDVVKYCYRWQSKFQSTLPLRGATLCGMPIDYAAEKFQSTLPLRGATWLASPARPESNFNPHSPCGERLAECRIHADHRLFQSTLPLRGATAEMRHF